MLDSGVYFERQGSAICAASAIEMACWDIKGKALDQPVYQLLGGRFRDRVPPYANGWYQVDRTPEALDPGWYVEPVRSPQIDDLA